MIRNLTIDKFIKFAILTALIAVVGIVVYSYSNLALYAIIALVFSYLLDPIVNRMQAAGINRTLSITLVLATVLMIIFWISTSIIPIVGGRMAILTRQLHTENLINIANLIEMQLRSNFDFIPEGYLRDNVATIVNDIFNFDRFSDVLGNLIGLFTNIFAALIIIPFATFFFLKDGYKIRRDLLRLIPNKYFETTLSLIDKIESRLGRYFRSVMLQCTIVGITSWIALTMAGLSNAGTVGLTIGIANTIPYFGPVIGYLLSMIVAIVETGDFSLVLPSLLAVAFTQLLDNVVLQPLIFSKSADIHPVAVLFIVMVGAQTAGILGMLVAIPIATVAKITVNQISWSISNYYIFRSEPVSFLSSSQDPKNR